MPYLYWSSDFSSCAFCPTCGSTLGAVDDNPTIGMLLGTFDLVNRKELMPTNHSYRGWRPRRLHVEAELP